MADPVTLSVISIASMGFSVAGGLTRAQGQASGAEFQAAQAQRAAEYGKIAADQTDTRMRQDLGTTLANIAAVRASANTDSSSPTQAAILSRVSEQQDEARKQRLNNINAQVTSDEGAAAFYRSSANNAIFGGVLGGVGTIIGGLGGLGGYGSGTGPGGSY